MIPYNGATDKNGFPLDSKGKHFFICDKDGKCFVEFQDGTIIRFSPTNKIEVGKSADEISQRLASGFPKALRDTLFLKFAEAGKKKLFEMGRQPGKPAEIHGVSIYFDRINNFLNYIGNAGGFPFKELIYLKYKDEIKSHFLAVKSGLYGESIPKKRLDFVDAWINLTDGTIEQERKKFERALIEQRSKKGESVYNPSLSEIETGENFAAHFKNNFDDVSSSEVYKHFSQLVKKHHLSEVYLRAYLKMAFEEQRKPEAKLYFENVRTKQDIRKIFYSYFNIKAAKPPRRKPDYVKLLCDYFNGFDYETTCTNFSK